MTPSSVVARMTVTRALGAVTIVEVHESASFSEFYRFFTQDGRRRSTKRLVRKANRNEGLTPWGAHLQQPGLEVLAEAWRKMKNVEKVTVRILKKRMYRQLISANPSELGQVKVNTRFAPEPGYLATPAGALQFRQVEKRNRYKIHAGAER